MLQQRLAGLMPKQALSKALRDGRIGHGEYVEMLKASGWTHKQAHDALKEAHAESGRDDAELPDAGAEDNSPHQFRHPGVRRKKYKSINPSLSGHPLDLPISE